MIGEQLEVVARESSPPPLEMADATPEQRRLVQKFRALALLRGLLVPRTAQEMYDFSTESDRGRTSRAMGWFATSLGCLVAAGISWLTFNAGALAFPVALTSGAVAYGFTRVAAGALRLVFDAYPRNPASLAPLRWLAGVSSAIALLCLAALMYMRFSDDAGTLAWLSFALLGFEGAALCAGAALEVMASIDLWSPMLMRQYADATANVEAERGRRRYAREMFRIAALTVGLLVSSASSAMADRILVQPDFSGWVDQRAYKQFVDGLLKVIRAEATQITGIDVMPFAAASGSWNVRLDVHEWGVAPEKREFRPDLVTLTLAGRIVKGAADREIAEARHKWQHAADAAEADYWRRVDTALAQARARLLSPAARRATCTSFVDLAVRSARYEQPQLVITDGLRLCNDRDVAVPSIAAPMAVVLLPSLSDPATGSEARVFFTRQRRLQLVLPRAAIVMPHDPGVIKGLITGTTPTAPESEPPRQQTAARREAIISMRPQQGVMRPVRPAAPSSEAASDLANVLTGLIEALQRRHVRESIGPNDGQCFTERDLASFVAAGIPAQAADSAREDPRFAPIVAQLGMMSRPGRAQLLSGVKKPLHKSWTELGRVTPEGQTDAGVRAEFLIAAAIADLLSASAERRDGHVK